MYVTPKDFNKQHIPFSDDSKMPKMLLPQPLPFPFPLPAYHVCACEEGAGSNCWFLLLTSNPTPTKNLKKKTTFHKMLMDLGVNNTVVSFANQFLVVLKTFNS